MSKPIKLLDIPLAWRKIARELGVVYVQGKGWFCNEPVPEKLLMFVPNEIAEKPGRQANVGQACPKCGCHTILTDSKHAPFWSCSAYPRCDGKISFYAEDNNKMNPGKSLTKNAIPVVPPRIPSKAVYGKPCPKCGSQTILRPSHYEPFWGCTQFPQCKGKIKSNESPQLL